MVIFQFATLVYQRVLRCVFPKMMPELPKGILSDPRFQWLFRSAGGVHFWPGLGGNGGGVAIATSSAGFGALKNVFSMNFGWLFMSTGYELCIILLLLLWLVSSTRMLLAWAAPWTQHSQNSWSQVVEKPLVFQNPIKNPINIPSASHIPEVFQDSTTGQSTAKRKCCDSTCELQLAVQTGGTDCLVSNLKAEVWVLYDLWYYVVSLLTFYCNHCNQQNIRGNRGYQHINQQTFKGNHCASWAVPSTVAMWPKIPSLCGLPSWCDERFHGRKRRKRDGDTPQCGRSSESWWNHDETMNRGGGLWSRWSRWDFICIYVMSMSFYVYRSAISL